MIAEAAEFHLTPIYGWGWYEASGDPYEVPPAFRFAPSQVGDGDLPATLFGQLSSPGHPLDGMWLLLSLRTPAWRAYTVHAFDKTPSATDYEAMVRGGAALTGFAELA